MTKTIDLLEFPDRETLAEALADVVADALRAKIADRGAATIAVSGGSTPKLFFHALSKRALDWAQVTITLVDERWAPDTEERSNARFVKENLLRDAAAAATFVPLYVDSSAPEGALHDVQQRIADLLDPLTVVTLGMGEDGHTASLFHGGDRLEDALDPTGRALVLPMRAPHADEPRVTLTLPVLLAAKTLVLHIEGAKKREVLDRALGGEDAMQMPIRAVIGHAPTPLKVFWAP